MNGHAYPPAGAKEGEAAKRIRVVVADDSVLLREASRGC
jgi:hypothetical protein